MSQYDALVWNEEQIIAFAGIVCSIQREIADTSQGLATVKQEVQTIKNYPSHEARGNC